MGKSSSRHFKQHLVLTKDGVAPAHYAISFPDFKISGQCRGYLGRGYLINIPARLSDLTCILSLAWGRLEEETFYTEQGKQQK